MDETPLIRALTDQEQFDQAAAWAAQCFANRPNGLAPIVTIGAVSVRMMGALDDPHARVMALNPSDSMGMGVQLGHSLLEAAGLLFAAGCHVRDAERAQDARCVQAGKMDPEFEEVKTTRPEPPFPAGLNPARHLQEAGRAGENTDLGKSGERTEQYAEPLPTGGIAGQPGRSNINVAAQNAAHHDDDPGVKAPDA